MKGKVCHLTSAHNYNDIRIFIKECRSLASNGYEVHYVVPSTEIQLTEIDGVVIHGINRKVKNRIDRMLNNTKMVYQKALEIDADIYHFHDPELIPIGLKLIRKGKKVIYDIHEDVPKAILSKYYINKFLRGIISRIFKIYENNAAKKFSYLITATPNIGERFKKINRNTITINNYPILKELYANESESIKQKQISYVGGISIIRGALQVIEASKDIPGKVKLAGPILETEIKNKIEDTSEVEYLSILNREEVKKLLSESLAGIVTFLPEPNHVDAQPNKMFEYMSAGIAVIGSNFPLWKEIIEGNECGICVDPESPKEIKQAMLTILNNPEEAIEMGKRGRKAIENKYNWEQEEKKLLSVYEKLLNS